jgi:hypothetical protein
MPIAGVYVIFGPDGRVYVGESEHILRRSNVEFARRIGLSWTILRYMPNTTRPERHRIECAVHEAYRRLGVAVVSINHKETIARAHAAIDIEARTEKIRASWRDGPSRKMLLDAKAKARAESPNSYRTPGNRAAAARAGWITRRANGHQGAGRFGPSKRTLQRRRAEADRQWRLFQT